MQNVTYTLTGDTAPTTVKLSDEDLAILRTVAAQDGPVTLTITSVTPITTKQAMLARRAARREIRRTAAPVVVTAADYAKVEIS